MNVILSRAQIDQLYSMMCEYPDEDCIELDISSSSGIGQTITAAIRYAARTRVDFRDITDIERW